MPRIAVVTPYYKEATGVLRQCHDSVVAQGDDVDHFLVADGFPNEAVARWPVKHVALPQPHADNGNTPRAVGCLLADAQGYDFIAFLDADNWFHPQHLQSLLAMHRQTGALVCTSFRTFHRPDGTDLRIQEGAEDRLEHVDTSCFLLHRNAFGLNAVWSRMPRELGPMCDRVLLAAALKERFAIASSGQRTVAFRTQYALHYALAGQPPPPDAKPADVLAPSYRWLMSKEGIDACFHRLGFWPLSFVRV